MPRRLMIGLLAAVLCVTALAVYVVIEPGRRPRVAKGQLRRVLPYADARNRTLRDVTGQVTISSENGTICLQKAPGGRWRIVEPFSDWAIGEAVTRLLDLLRDLEYDRAVPLDAEGPAKYGVGQGSLVVKIRTEDGTRTVKVGKEAPGRSAKENRVYVRVDREKQVYAVDAALVAALARGAEQYRDRRVFQDGIVQARRLEVVEAGRRLAIRDVRTHWEIEGDEGNRVSTEALVHLLKAVAELQGREFIDAPESDYGFARPWFTCTLDTWDGPSTALELGKPVDGPTDSFYGRRAGQKSVFTVSTFDLRGLRVTADDLREGKDAIE